MPARRNQPACTHCRQMKHKCDARDTYPASCTRCALRRIDCILDYSFRRVAKRERLNAVEEELEKLKAESLSATTSTPLGKQPRLSSSSEPADRNVRSVGAGTPTVSASCVLQTFQTQRIEDAEVLPSTISELLNLYYARYHDKLPILPALSTFATIYADCQLLLWVVIALTCQHIPECSSLRHKLLKPIHNLTSDVLEAARHPLATVQALLILCWWPLESIGTAGNPSWLYCGAAIHAALRCGLHRPASAADFQYFACPSDDMIEARRRTWAACIIINQTISCYLGVPATVPIRHSSPSLLNAIVDGLPLNFQQHTRIAYQDYEVCDVLGNLGAMSANTLTEIEEFQPWIQTFDRRYQVMQVELGSSCSYEVEMAFLKARLNLFSFLCVVCLNTPRDPPIWAISHIIESSKCASRLIEVASNAAAETSVWSTGVRLAIYHATFLLLKLSASQWNFVDRIETKSAIAKGWGILRNASHQKHDQFDRVCSVIEYISTRGDNQGSYGESISVKSRMASNIVYDTIFHGKERFSKHVRESRPVDLVLAAESAPQTKEPAEELMDPNWDALIDLSFLEADFNMF